ncbi:MAG: hypothetical protein KatS3mg051_1307 [Anaerolineae bacterium]|nr:MAG: hypothetical protein KatS3mg051_1307 [Anaerolineae bacterium]
MRSVYTAAGDDGSTPKDLVKTTTFRGDDDLNVVVRLGSHNRELAVSAVFTGPAGEVYTTDALEADKNSVAEVVLGLDWEAQGAVFWTPGEWRVDVYVDEQAGTERPFHRGADRPRAGGLSRAQEGVRASETRPYRRDKYYMLWQRMAAGADGKEVTVFCRQFTRPQRLQSGKEQARSWDWKHRQHGISTLMK